jgi:hypothetical protein
MRLISARSPSPAPTPGVWLPFGDASWGLSAAADGTALGTSTGAANRLDLHPVWFGGGAPSVATLGLQVTTFIASALAKCVIYEQDPLNAARLILRGQTVDLDCGSNGAKTAALPFTFHSHSRWFLGVHMSSTAAFRAIALPALWPLASHRTSTTQGTVLRYTATYASGPPEELTIATSNITSTTAAAVIMGWTA